MCSIVSWVHLACRRLLQSWIFPFYRNSWVYTIKIIFPLISWGIYIWVYAAVETVMAMDKVTASAGIVVFYHRILGEGQAGLQAREGNLSSVIEDPLSTPSSPSLPWISLHQQSPTDHHDQLTCSHITSKLHWFPHGLPADPQNSYKSLHASLPKLPLLLSPTFIFLWPLPDLTSPKPPNTSEETLHIFYRELDAQTT